MVGRQRRFRQTLAARLFAFRLIIFERRVACGDGFQEWRSRTSSQIQSELAIVLIAIRAEILVVHHKPLMMDWETTAFFLRTLEFIKTWISPKMMRASW